MQWISRFVEELKNDKWVLPALKQIREICQLFPEVSMKEIYSSCDENRVEWPLF